MNSWIEKNIQIDNDRIAIKTFNKSYTFLITSTKPLYFLALYKSLIVLVFFSFFFYYIYKNPIDFKYRFNINKLELLFLLYVYS